jgi:topoisomerase-4 subunit A
VSAKETVYSLDKIMSERFGRYSKYIIQERALPDVRDGLKPVQRRILYSMYREKNTFANQYRKSAKTVGNVIGNYHPHGDTSVYDAMVRLSQEWKMNVPLIDLHGNKGSIDGDGPAAMRYTEARMAKISDYLMKNLGEKTVQMILNFDDTDYEPVVLPALFPNLLVNGATGISAGYATNIPAHNFNEVMNAVIAMVKKPDIELKEILKYIKGPDFATGGLITKTTDFYSNYQTGKGRFVVYAEYEVEKMRGNKGRINISQIPFDVNKANLIKTINQIIVDKKIDGMLVVRDESDREGMSIVIEIDNVQKSDMIMGYLYKNTELSKNFSMNSVVISDNSPKLFGLKEILAAFISHYREVFIRKTQFAFDKAQARAHILEGLIIAIDAIDKVIKIIRASANKQDAINNLVKEFNLSKIQAEAIVNLQLYRLSNTDKLDLEKEQVELDALIDDLYTILNNEDYLKEKVLEQLTSLNKEFKIKRRTRISDEDIKTDFAQEDLISDEQVGLIIDSNGYIRKIDPEKIETLTEQISEELLFANKIKNNAVVTLITSQGNYIDIPLFKISKIKINQNPTHISAFAQIQANEKIIIVTERNKQNVEQNLVLVTNKANVKRIKYEFTQTKTNKPSRLIKLTSDEELLTVFETNNYMNIMQVSKQGNVIIFNENEVPVTNIKSGGVKSQKIDINDEIIFASSLDNEQITNKSIRLKIKNKKRVKLVELNSITLTKRNGKGKMLAKDIEKIEGIE